MTRTWNAGRCQFDAPQQRHYAGRTQGSRALRGAACAAGRNAGVRRRLSDAEPDGRHAERAQPISGTTRTANTTSSRNPPGARVVYNLLTLAPPDAHQLLAFTSCRRFSGRFHVRPKAIDVVLDLEGLSLGPNESWPLEEFAFHSGGDREALLESVASRLAATSTLPASGSHRSRSSTAREILRAALRLVFVVLLRAQGHRAAGARQPRRHCA